MSHQEHSSYLRQVQDTPIGLLIVRLQLKVRRFRCPNPMCEQQTFAEQFHGLVGRRRQRTDRLIANLTQIGLALGGKAGARLAGKLAMTASPSTLLRLLHRLKAPAIEEPRIIGIDDWALRKGRAYGTIIVDHESGRVIDLLAKRDCETVKAWLEKHPTVATVTRDRSGEYREAISQALPDAVQIADRWHLLKNLRETVERHFSRHYQTVAAVKARLAQGVYTTDVAKEFNLSRRTVSKWLHCETLPPDTRGRFKQKCMIDHYAPYLHERTQASCTNPGTTGAAMAGNRWPRSSPGFAGGRSLVGKWIRQNYRANTKTADPPVCKKTKAVAPCPRELAWLLIRHSDELEAEEKQLVNVLLQDDALAELRQLAHQFIQMVRNGLTDKWAA